MKNIKLFVKATGVAVSGMLLLWGIIMFINMKPILWWKDTGDRICTATQDSDGHLSAHWAYGTHDYSSLRGLMVVILLVSLVGGWCKYMHDNHGWFD